MRVVGVLTTVIATVVTAGLLIVLVMSLPDIKRYLKIRAM